MLTISSDDGHVTLAERVCSLQLDDEHFRHCLAERIGWAVADAENAGSSVVELSAPRHSAAPPVLSAA